MCRTRYTIRWYGGGTACPRLRVNKGKQHMNIPANNMYPYLVLVCGDIIGGITEGTYDECMRLEWRWA